MISPTALLRGVANRNVLKNLIRSHSHNPVPGENLPFDISNRYKFTLLFMVYVGSGFAIPFLMVRHQLRK